MIEISVGQSKQARARYTNGVENGILPIAPLWTIAEGFGKIAIGNVVVTETESLVTIVGLEEGTATLRLSPPGFPNVDVPVNVSVPPPPPFAWVVEEVV
jgi:hypothetical protein